MFVHFKRKNVLLFYNPNNKTFVFPVSFSEYKYAYYSRTWQIFVQWRRSHFVSATWRVFSVSLQRWVFSLRLSSLATEHQSASRFVVCGDYRLGCDQHVAEPGEIPYLFDRVKVCLSGLHLIGSHFCFEVWLQEVSHQLKKGLQTLSTKTFSCHMQISLWS